MPFLFLLLSIEKLLHIHCIVACHWKSNSLCALFQMLSCMLCCALFDIVLCIHFLIGCLDVACICQGQLVAFSRTAKRCKAPILGHEWTNKATDTRRVRILSSHKISPDKSKQWIVHPNRFAVSCECKWRALIVERHIQLFTQINTIKYDPSWCCLKLASLRYF